MKKVFVGLSGGVDSAVSALLLKQLGLDVTGVFIRGWQPDWIPCTWKNDRISAMRTAAYLDIPFVTLDLEKEYKEKIVGYLLEEYKKGNTPNPDMLCNREIKFGDFLNWSIKNGADFVATGHYALVKHSGPPSLWESEDKEKDQSYFLSQLTQKELDKIIFPIGRFQKKQIRQIAAENKLPVASRKDSQGICFVGDLSMKEFLKKELTPQKGNVLNEKNEVIGEHDGAILYTIGERHGFTITKNTKNQEYLYVANKNILNNTITVTAGTNAIENGSPQVEIKNFSFTTTLEDVLNVGDLLMRIRYRGEKYDIEIVQYNKTKGVFTVNCLQKLDYAHGQFAVLYDGEKCLGGGEL